jgi:Right handed beta helix region
MSIKNFMFFCCAVLISELISIKSFARQVTSKIYYVDTTGNDDNPGTKISPFKTIQKINTIHLKPGDAISFKSGQTFKGTVKINEDIKGDKLHPIIIRSYGKGRATINGDSVSAISLYKTSYISINNLILTGIGRKGGNHKPGLDVAYSSHININNIDISGFQKAGLSVYISSYVTAKSVNTHDNGYAGISLLGTYGHKNVSDIKVINCRAENNPGDPTELDNHSGNGIVAGFCRNILIDGCTANNNGWDMPRVGNGPVGIWAYEADNVVIQHCLAYQNKTHKGADDGGGFDFDGGVTNSIIQYCVSYENQGAGYCLFQYAGAGPWHHNIVRYNIGENDGAVSPAQAGIYVWNSAYDEKQFYDCQFYGNIIYNANRATLSFANPNANKGFIYSGNIFVGADKLIIGIDSLNLSQYAGNDWWSLKSGFNIDGIKSLKTWAIKSGKEIKNGKITGLNIFPKFSNPGKARITSASQIQAFIKSHYQLADPKLKAKLKLLQLPSN